MKIEKIPIIEDGFVIIGERFLDKRGVFEETWNFDELFKSGVTLNFKQSNMSYSSQGVLRGLHLQKNNPQGKLIKAIHGEIFDVMVDLRKESKTFKNSFALRISDKSNVSIFCPPGVAHGFFTLSNASIVNYLCTTTYDKESDSGINWADGDLNIEWPFNVNSFTPMVSLKDSLLPTLAQWISREYN